MFNWLRSKRVSKPEGNESMKTPRDARGAFQLSYGSLVIGVLSHGPKGWEFKYTDEFRAEDGLSALVEFPNKDAVYSSEELWHTFAGRIPSKAQPAVMEAIRRNGLDEENELVLLQHFGTRTVSNPYVLRPVHLSATPSLIGNA